MKPPTRIPLSVPLRSNLPNSFVRSLHSSFVKYANVAPILGTGPPPEPPTPEVVNAHQRVERRRKQAELLQQAQHLKSSKDGKSSPLRKRFWKDVHVKPVDGSLQVHLDSRPLRHPRTKEIVNIPVTKPNLALALAIEWDLLSSAQEATRQHLIPLTSLVCRALDIAEDDVSSAPEEKKIRNTIATMVMKYLDTDSLLCWAPPAGPHDMKNDAGESLRDVQKRTAEEVVSFLTSRVWPGVEIKPVLDGNSIVPQKQAEGVREVVQGWVLGLGAWDLAGLERAVLAGKSLVAAARFIAEWSEGSIGAAERDADEVFGADEAAKATNLEVAWQAKQWGEVEDTHDVNKEDTRRQLGSVILLVSGTGKGNA